MVCLPTTLSRPGARNPGPAGQTPRPLRPPASQWPEGKCEDFSSCNCPKGRPRTSNLERPRRGGTAGPHQTEVCHPSGLDLSHCPRQAVGDDLPVTACFFNSPNKACLWGSYLFSFRNYFWMPRFQVPSNKKNFRRRPGTQVPRPRYLDVPRYPGPGT